MYRPDLETAPPEAIGGRQLARLNELLAAVLPQNAFYTKKFGARALPISWDAFGRLPFTTKAELVADQASAPPLGTIATCAPERYTTYHQTSGTTGRRCSCQFRFRYEKCMSKDASGFRDQPA